MTYKAFFLHYFQEHIGKVHFLYVGRAMFSLHNVGTFIQIISSFVAYLLTVSPVGYFKAWVASACGDDTARDEGFMTLDPLVHCDMIGLIALFLLGIGWGTNIPVSLHALNEPYRKLKIAAALFAPSMMHIVLTFVAAIVWYLTFASSTFIQTDSSPLMLVLARILLAFILLNSFLAVMSFFINGITVIALFASERYATIAQHAYYIILLGPLALLLVLELFGIHVLGYMHTAVLYVTFFIGKAIAVLFGIH